MLLFLQIHILKYLQIFLRNWSSMTDEKLQSTVLAENVFPFKQYIEPAKFTKVLKVIH